MKPVLLMGTRAYATVFIDSFSDIPGVTFAGCLENMDRARCADTVMDLPIHWWEEADHLRESHVLACSLGTTLRSGWITQMQARGFEFATLVHPSCVVSARTTLQTGVAIDILSVVAGFSDIGPHVRLGRRCSVGHHTVIGPFSTLHPGSIVSGNCRIGRQVTVGTGAVVIDGIEIGDGAVIAAGAVVTRHVPAGALFAGNPAAEKRADYGPK